MASVPPGWQIAAAAFIRERCYPPDGLPPAGHNISQDLAWYRFKVAKGESPERIAAGIRGAVILCPKLHAVKWSPAKFFSKRGDWPNLFERCVHADSKAFQLSPDKRRQPQQLADILADLVSQGMARRLATVRRGPGADGPTTQRDARVIGEQVIPGNAEAPRVRPSHDSLRHAHGTQQAQAAPVRRKGVTG